ncbi:sister chromatid cohesion protein 1 [Dinochytrium kinnereticum]|nr:sister chromatid cohesion protein 1 [Dinochytrium kinnereticum]
MFYSESVLSKKGSLAKVWLAAHWERKLSKSQFLQTNIQTSVGAIVGEGHEPMALRLSGQLLLGVVRIYSRKARYLLEDCNEALVKIKLAFRPGIVDMPQEQAIASYHSITLPDAISEFDILLQEPLFDINSFLNERPTSIRSSQNASATQITLRDSQSFSRREWGNKDLLAEDAEEMNFEQGNALNFDLPDMDRRDELDFSGIHDIPEIEVRRDANEDYMKSPSISAVNLPKALVEGEVAPDVLPIEENDFIPDPMGQEEISLEPDVPMDITDVSMAQSNIPLLDVDVDVEEREPEIVSSTPAKETKAMEKSKPRKGPKRRKLAIDNQTELSSSAIKNQLSDASDILVEESFVGLHAGCKGKDVLIPHPSDLSFLFSCDLPFVPDLDSVEEPIEVMRLERASGVLSARSTPRSSAKRKQQPENEDYDISAVDIGEFHMELPGAPEVFDMPEQTELTTGLAEDNLFEANEIEQPEISEVLLTKGVEDTSNELSVDETLETVEAGEIMDNESAEMPVRLIKLLHVHDVQAGEKGVSFDHLVGKAGRSESVKLFFEVLVLKTKNLVDVSQDTPYSDFLVRVL